MGRIRTAHSILLQLAFLLGGHGLSAQMLDSVLVEGVSSIRVPLELIVVRTHEPSNYIHGGKTWWADLGPAATGNITQALQAMPSMSLKRYAPGGLATPTMRGTGAGHTQVFWDGLPLNSAMLGQQDLALGAGNVFRGLQALYGGNSLLLGSGGLGGALNLNSGAELFRGTGQQLRLRQQVGSWGSHASNAEFDVRQVNWISSTRLYFNTAQNNFPYHNSALPGSPVQKLSHAAILQFGGMQDLSFTLKKNTFFAKLWALQSDRLLPATMLSATTDESQADAALRVVGGWIRGFRRTELRLSGACFREGMLYAYPSAGIHSQSRSTRLIGNVDLVNHKQRKWWLRQVGLRYLYDQASTDGYADGVYQNQVTGMVRGEWNPSDHKHVSMLIRQEIYDDQLSPLLAFLGSNFALCKQKLNVSANLARNYRYPTLNDRFWIPGGNPNLRPELSHSAELNVQSNPRIKGIYSSVSLGGYYNHVNDWILWVPGTGAIWHPENARRVKAMGMEANASLERVREQSRLLLNLSYSYNQTRDQDGYQLIYTPQHTAFAKLILKWRRLEVQYFQDWNSRRYTVADNSAFIKGFSTGDLSLGYRLGREERPAFADYSVRKPIFADFEKSTVDIRLGLRNIWNAQFQTVAWRPMPGRSFFLRLDFTLGWG